MYKLIGYGSNGRATSYLQILTSLICGKTSTDIKKSGLSDGATASLDMSVSCTSRRKRDDITTASLTLT